jgi:signal transduction histidine kinase
MTIRTDQSESKLHTLGPWVVRSPRVLRVLLDLLFLMTALATFGQVWDPDVLFHLIWVFLTLEAFLFGLRVTAIRIGIAGLLLLGYFNLATLQPSGGGRIASLDLAEWPLMVVIAAIVAVMADRVASTSRHFAQLYRKASEQLLTAQEGERRRLGMDLHDGVGQTLAALVFTLDAAEAELWANGTTTPPHGHPTLRRAQELAAIALDETRDVAYRLRPDRLVETGLVASTERLASTAGGPITIVADPRLKVPGLLEPQDEMSVYRIVQEALNNAIRHAHAKHIEVEFASSGHELTATISDNGKGFDVAAAEPLGLGLAGMRERAVVLRSDLVIRSRPGSGTTISVTAPLRQAIQAPIAVRPQGAVASR